MNEIVLEVMSNGPGVVPEVLARIMPEVVSKVVPKVMSRVVLRVVSDVDSLDNSSRSVYARYNVLLLQCKYIVSS